VPNTNGWSVKRAVLYARVSGEDQAKKGYSLADQLDTLRDWCSTNDYEVIDEVQDRGYSGAYLERPGLDRVREMVAGGRVDAVVVLFRDRIARGVYAQLLSACLLSRSAADRRRRWTSATDRGTMGRHGLFGPISTRLPGLVLPLLGSTRRCSLRAYRRHPHRGLSPLATSPKPGGRSSARLG
jgi:Resolvase, N terminal domain